MITHVNVRGDFIFLAVACNDGGGAAVDPDSAQAIFYQVSPLTGGLSAYTDAGANGVLTLIKQDGQTGFFGAAEQVAAFEEGQYVVLFKVVVGGAESVSVDYLSIDEDPHSLACVANAVYDNTTDTLAVNAWLVENGEPVSSPFDCTFTLYDDAGIPVGNALFSDQPDLNGVFRLTMQSPELEHDRLYYGSVEIYDGMTMISSLTGLVTVE